MLSRHHFLSYVGNSLIIATGSTVWSVVLAACGGYGLARFNFRGKGALMGFILLAQSFPRILMVIPYFQMVVSVAMKDTYQALIVAYGTFVLPFCVWMMKEYYAQIPRELEESAMIDGCNHYSAFWRITLPLVRPALGATAILSFLTAWNEYEFALVLTSAERVRPVSVAIAYFLGEFTTEWNNIMAAAALGTLPVVLIFLLVQRQLVQGLTAGAVKG